MTAYNDLTSQYITATFVHEDEILKTIREDIPRQGLPTIEIKPEEGRFLQVLLQASKAKTAVEIGTLGGYSGTWIARGLVPGGKLITIEKDPAHAAVARKHFAFAGLADRVEIRVGNAHQVLPELVSQGPFDFIFIDADKSGYFTYLDWALANARPGGLIAAHNALWRGGVVRPTDDESRLMRDFNQRIAKDQSLISTIFPAGDGTMIAVKQT